MNDLLFQCPKCHSSLTVLENGHRCSPCNREYVLARGIHRLLTEERQLLIAPFLSQYSAVRHAEGRGACDPAFLLRLPNVDSHEWRLRSRSAQHVLRAVRDWRDTHSSVHPRILDVGAGNCWLTRLLEEDGNDVTACDIFDDEFDGLRAGQHYIDALQLKFSRVLAHFDELPFADATFDIVIFNASLHYSSDTLRTLRESLRILQPDGMILINDSPMYRTKQGGEQMLALQRKYFSRFVNGDQDPILSSFLVEDDLDQWRMSLHVHVEKRTVNYGLRHLIHNIKTMLIEQREPVKMKLLCLTRQR